MSWWHWLLIIWFVGCVPLALVIGRFIKVGNPTDEDEGEL